MIPKTISNKKDLMKALKENYKKGFAFDDEETQLELRCVATPVRSFTGKVVADISLSGLSTSFNQQNLPLLIDSVIKAGCEISKELCYHENLKAIL